MIINRFILVVLLCFAQNDLFGLPPNAKSCIDFARKELLQEGSTIIKKVFFGPCIKMKKVILGLIHDEKHTIQTAQYRVTDKDIADALGEASERGVKVVVVSDISCLFERSQKLGVLKQAGAEVRFVAGTDSLMHHKFYLFTDTLGNKVLVTGSANASCAGFTKNNENVIMMNDPFLWTEYNEYFSTRLYQLSQPEAVVPGLYTTREQSVELKKICDKKDQALINDKRFITTIPSQLAPS